MRISRPRPSIPGFSPPTSERSGPEPAPSRPGTPPNWFQKLEQSLLSGTSRLIDQAQSLAEAFGKAINQLEKEEKCGENGQIDRLRHFFSPEPQDPACLEEGLKTFVSPCGPDTRVACPPTPLR